MKLCNYLHDTVCFDGEFCPLCNAMQENNGLRQESGQAVAIVADLQSKLGKAEAKLEKAKEVLETISRQVPETPNYWSSCGQCDRNIDDAQEALAAINAGKEKGVNPNE